MQRKRIGIRYPRWIVSLLFIAGILAGGLFTSWQPALAQQRFGRDDLKSVPKSFLEGGDRVLTTLKEIAQYSKATADSLQRIEQKAGDADKRHRELMKKVDQLDARLKQLQDVMQNPNTRATSSRTVPSR